VSDVVDGIIATLNYQPHQCGETFNLGRGQPEVVSKLVRFLEEDLGKKAVVVSIWLIMCYGCI
jgi:nucleoside-diphosphate-sugar epimerase